MLFVRPAVTVVAVLLSGLVASAQTVMMGASDFPFYSEADGMTSSLVLNNNTGTPMPVMLTFYGSDGEYSPSPVTVQPGSPLRMSIGDLLRTAGPKFRFGNVHYAYNGSTMQVTGQVTVMSVKSRMSFESRMAMAMNYKTTRLDGIIWLPDGDAKAPVALTNIGKQPIAVTLIAGGAVGGKPVTLNVRETRLVDASELVHGNQKSFLLTLQHNGSPGDLITAGAVLNPETGYSSTLEFVDWTTRVSNKLAGAHFLFGAANPNSGLPQHLRFRAPLVLANVGPSPTQAVVSVDYTAKGIPQHVHIDQVMLKPGEVRTMDLAERLSGVESNGPIDDAGVDITYNGAPGSVLAKLTSVDQSGDYSFDMPIKDPLSGAPYRVSGSYPWRLDSGYTTVLHLKNTLAKDVYAGVQFRFNGGQYAPARVHLAPFQTVALDLAEIRSQQKVDLDGNIFPADAVSGRIAWHEEEPGSLIGRAEVVQIAMGIASSFSCDGACVCGYQTVNDYDAPAPVNLILGGTNQTLAVNDVRQFCDYSQSTYNVAPSSSITTTNGNVATASGAAISPAGVGQATINASYTGLGWNAVQDACAYPLLVPAAQVNVYNPTLVCSPTPVVRGATVTCTVSNVQAPLVSAWQFTGTAGGTANGPAGSLTWIGTVVAGGTVKATISGKTNPLSATITVNPRTNFTVSLPSPTKVANGTSPLPTLHSPPDTSEGSLGWSAYTVGVIVHTSGSIAAGPNTGFVYVTSLDTSASKFVYELNPGIDNPNDDFAVHQYGRCGIPSLSQIVTAVTNHEIGASSSHYSQGATQMAQDNPGLVAEPVVGLPGTNPVTMANSVFNSLTPKFNAVIAAAAPEPPSNLPAGINYPNPSYLPCPP